MHSQEYIFKPAILYIDDEPSNLKVFQKAFASDYLVKTCLSAEEALEILKEEDFPLIIADQKMPGMTGIELCEKLIEAKPQSIRMILTAYSETQLLLEAINRGHVHDYIVKPWRKSELKPIIDKAFEDYKQKALKLKQLETQASQAESLKKQIKEVFDFESVIGISSGLRPVMEVIKKAAPTNSTILISGETGTGKELMARAIHENSKRNQTAFVAVHAAALSPTVLESELFGHEKGAFTGADQHRKGRFEIAQGGTLFLDELSEVPEEIQIKLLRVLQEKEIQRVGGNQVIPIDVRLVAATNKDLKARMAAGKFRKDLFYRLNVIDIRVPPLRERLQDVPELAQYFLDKFNRQIGRHLSLSSKAIKELSRYDWPGNVRELQNIMERAVILSAGPEIEVEDLNLNFEEAFKVEKVDLQNLPNTAAFSDSFREQIYQEEREKLKSALWQAGGNISETARLLNMARSTLFDRLKKYGLL